MGNTEKQLYQLYLKSPDIGNKDAAAALGWTEQMQNTTKSRLKKKGLITVTPHKIICNKKFLFEDTTEEDTIKQAERFKLKQEYYEQLLDLCMERLKTRELSDSAFTALVLEIRQILAQL